jgi:membrane protease YdiL (CAAX protease family)
LAVTAGLCEEFLYRGFAMAVIRRAGLPTAVVVLLSSILFGLAHLYQGRGGFVSTMVLGLLFGFARTALGSLLPVVVWHMGVDVVAGIAGPRYLLVHKELITNTA